MIQRATQIRINHTGCRCWLHTRALPTLLITLDTAEKTARQSDSAYAAEQQAFDPSCCDSILRSTSTG